MNDLVKNSVESRKMAIYNNYIITNQNILDKIDDYFKRLEEFASNYDDIMKFENDFLNSSLSSEYTNLFTLIVKDEMVNESKNENKLSEKIKDDITHKVRSRAKREAYDKARDIPVVGDIMNIKQHVDFFSWFKKNK